MRVVASTGKGDDNDGDVVLERDPSIPQVTAEPDEDDGS